MTTPMQQLYQQVILDQSRARTGNAALLGDAVSAPHGYSHQVNPTCGDENELELEIDDEDHVKIGRASRRKRDKVHESNRELKSGVEEQSANAEKGYR